MDDRGEARRATTVIPASSTRSRSISRPASWHEARPLHVTGGCALRGAYQSKLMRAISSSVSSRVEVGLGHVPVQEPLDVDQAGCAPPPDPAIVEPERSKMRSKLNACKPGAGNGEADILHPDVPPKPFSRARPGHPRDRRRRSQPRV